MNTTATQTNESTPRCICADLGCAPHQRHTLCRAHGPAPEPAAININVNHPKLSEPDWAVAYRLAKSVSWFILFMTFMLWLGGKVF